MMTYIPNLCHHVKYVGTFLLGVLSHLGRSHEVSGPDWPQPWPVHIA